MKKQPKLEIPKSTGMRMLDILALALSVFYVVYAALSYTDLPDKIPIHYDLNGQVDGMGGKSVLLLIVGIGLLLFVMLKVINNYPHTFNYPVKITEENAVEHYQSAMQMMSMMNVFCAAIFAYLVYTTIQTANGMANGVSPYFIYVVIGALILVIGYYFYKSVYKQKSKA
jgi:uncharacterized membrane protein